MTTIYVNDYLEYMAVCEKVKKEGGKILNMYANAKTKNGVKIAIIVQK